MIRKYGLIFLCLLFCVILSIATHMSFRHVAADDESEATPTVTPVIPVQFYLTPWDGIRGSIIRIKGSTFTPTTVVRFYFSSDIGDTSSAIDGKITAYKFLGSVWTDSGGFINNDNQPAGNQAVYPVPFRLDDGANKKNTPGGICYIYATYSNSKAVIAFARFTVDSLATMSIAPVAGFVGDTVSVTGSNFGSNENATAKLDDRDMVVTIGNRTTTGGDFHGTVEIPDSTDGLHTIYITDETGNIANATFTTTSKLTMNTTSQAFGRKIIVTGTGFSGHKIVAVSLNGRDLTPDEAPVTTSSFGRFQATITVPFDFTFVKGGKAVVSASVGTTAASAGLDITATSPLLAFSPEIDAAHPAYVGMKLGVTGMWFATGDRVDISVDDSGVSLGSVVVDDNSFFSIQVVLPPGKSGAHHLKATGTLGVAFKDYVIEGVAPPVPVLKSPRITGTSGDAPLLEWVSVSDPSGVTYDLQVAADKDFKALLIDKHVISGVDYTFTPAESVILPRGGAPCYWRVRAVDGASNASDWTPSSSFYIGFSWVSIPAWVIYAAAGIGVLVLVGVYLYYKRRSNAIPGSGSIN